MLDIKYAYCCTVAVGSMDEKEPKPPNIAQLVSVMGWYSWKQLQLLAFAV